VAEKFDWKGLKGKECGNVRAVFSLYATLGVRAVTNVIIAYNKTGVTSVISREVTGNCAIIGHYAERGGHSLTALRDNVPVPSSRGQEPIGH
jgi:hypothetical protein